MISTGIQTRYIAPAISEHRRKAILGLRRCMWAYVILVFAEGPIRKWLLPGLASPLLVVRDPIVLMACLYASRLHLFRGNRFISYTTGLGVVCVLASLAIGTNQLVTLYGWRADFFHIPMAVLIIQHMTREDLHKISTWLLRLSLPNALIMYVQYHSPPHSWINSGSEDTFAQIALVHDIIRPPGIFSFITGPASFYPIVLALILAPIGPKQDRFSPLRVSASIGVGMAAIFSGSRYLWVDLIIVLAVYFMATARYRPSDFAKRLPTIAGIGALIPVILAIPAVASALAVFIAIRVGGTENNNSKTGDFLARIANLVIEPVVVGYTYPLFGHGLGLETIVGERLAGLVGGEYGDAETEWTRHIIESGFILGALIIIMRIYMTFELLRRSILCARLKDFAPLMLWAAAAPWVFNGQIGQSTTLGMTVVGCGLTGLASRVIYGDLKPKKQVPAL